MDIGALAREYTPQMTRYAAQMLRDWGAAEEVVQDTWLRVWQSHETIDRIAQPRNYLMRIVHNQAVTYIRRHCHRWERVVLMSVLQSAMPVNPEERVMDRVDCERMAEVIAKLSPPYRVCVELRLAGALYHEIAEELHIPQGTVKSRMNYAFQRVRAMRAQWEKTA